MPSIPVATTPAKALADESSSLLGTEVLTGEDADSVLQSAAVEESAAASDNSYSLESVYTTEATGISGSGTSSSPWVITSAEGLTTFSTTSSYWKSGTYAKLGANITANSSFAGIGNSTTSYAGDFDGCGYYVYFSSKTFTFSGTGVCTKTQSSGLFNCITTGAYIHNVIVKGSITTTGTWYDSSNVSNGSAGIVGYMSGGRVSCCRNEASITYKSTSTSSSACVGGIVGSCASGTNYIERCANTGAITMTVSNTNKSYKPSVGGLIGFANNSGAHYIYDCYSTGNVSGTGTNSNVGGLAGKPWNSTYVKAYNLYCSTTSTLLGYGGWSASNVYGSGSTYSNIVSTLNNGTHYSGVSAPWSTAYTIPKLVWEVGSVACTGLTLNLTSTSVNKGSTVALTATKTPSSTTDSVNWNSSNTSVATVSSSGVVTGVAAGTATITATCGTKTATCTVTVKVPCTGISLSASSLSLKMGSTGSLTATASPTGTTDSVTWSTSNSSVATVSGGTVTPVAEGTATITATCGNYSATCTVTVSKIDLSNATVNLSGTSFTYDGSVHAPTVSSVTLSGYTPTYGSVVYHEDSATGTVVLSPTDAGTYYAVVTGNGNFTGSASAKFTIGAKSIASGYTASISLSSTTYTGSAITVTPSIAGLTKGTDYTVNTTSVTNAGTYTETFTGIGNYTGTLTEQFTIAQASFTDNSNVTVTLPSSSYIFTGGAIAPTPTVSFNSSTLGTGYTVSYSSNTNAGTATVTVTGSGTNFTGSKSVTFSIAQASIADATISEIADQGYTGSQITPTPVVKLNGNTLTAGTDYTLSYGDNTEIGTGTVTITAAGSNFTSGTSQTASFNIEWAAPRLVDGAYQLTYPKDVTWFASQVNDGNTTYNAKMTRDIDMSGTSMTAIGSSTYPYAGTFDGAGHTLSGISISTSASYTGLFGKTTGAATIKDLTVSGSVTSTVSNGDFVGGVVGYNAGAVTHVTSSVAVTASSAYNVGGICGFNDGGKFVNSSGTSTTTDGQGAVAACVVTGNVTGMNKVGGIAGENSGMVSSCLAFGMVYGANNSTKNGVGGIVGRNGNNNTAYEAGTINACAFFGTVGKTEQSWVGGIAGFNNELSSITNCYMAGSLATGHSYCNAICGLQEGASYTSNNYATSTTNNTGTTEAEIGISTTAAALKTNAMAYKLGTDWTFAASTDAIASILTAKSLSGMLVPAALSSNSAPTQTSISGGTAKVTLGGTTYTGSAITVTPSLTVGDVTLTEGTDYTVAYSKSTTACTTIKDAGTYTATFTGAGDYEGTATATFTISSASISGAKVTLPATTYYLVDGQAVTPEPTVTVGGATLVKGTDYTLSYANNTAVGTSATVTVTGMGNYAGTAWATFTIESVPGCVVQVRSGLQSSPTTSVANVSGGGLYASGAKATLKAPSVSGMAFVGWYEYANGTAGSEALSTKSTYAVTVAGDASYIALYAPASSTETVTISAAVDDNCSAMGTASVSATSGSATIGSQVTFKAEPVSSSYKFLYWTNSAGRIVSTSASYETTALKATSYTAVFAESNNSDVLVNFLDGSSGAFIRAQRYTSTQAAEIVKAPAPSKSGYDFVCWTDKVGGNELSESTVAGMIKTAASAGGVVTVYANYQAADSTYTATLVLVNESGAPLGESITSSGHVAGTPVQFNANSTYTSGDTTLCFDGFYSDADCTKLLSQSTSYTASFDSSDDATVYARYVESSETATKYASVTLAAPKATYTNVEKLTFSMSWSLPDGCTLVKAGFNRGLTDSLGSTSLTTLTGNSGMFTINVNMSSCKDSPYYVQAFVTYTYGDSETQYTIYSGDAAGTTSVAVGNNGTAAVCVSSSYNTLSGASSSN